MDEILSLSVPRSPGSDVDTTSVGSSRRFRTNALIPGPPSASSGEAVVEPTRFPESSTEGRSEAREPTPPVLVTLTSSNYPLFHRNTSNASLSSNT